MGKLQQEAGVLNDSDELRELILACEKMLASLSVGNARELLEQASEAQHLLDTLAQVGSDVRAEQSRLDTIQERIVKQARPIVAGVGGIQAFASLRDHAGYRTTERWWRLDDVLAERRTARLKQLGIIVAAIALIGIMGYAFRGVLFPPDPVGDAVNAAQRALQQGDLVVALQAIDLGLGQMPTSTTLLVWQGNVRELRKDPNAASSFDKARATTDEARFLMEHSQADLMFGNYDRVITSTSALIAQSPNAAEAYFVRASAYESKNDTDRALADLEKASEVAQLIGNDTLYATARIRIGTLMQSSLARATAAP